MLLLPAALLFNEYNIMMAKYLESAVKIQVKYH